MSGELKNMPENSRVWIYGANRDFTIKEKEVIDKKLLSFFPQWNSHGNSIIGGYEIIYDRIIVIAAYFEGIISGCAIDSKVAVIKDFDKTFSLDFLSRGKVFCKDLSGKLFSIDFKDLKSGIKNGIFSENMIVFDNLIDNLNNYHSSWEIPLKNSSYAKFFI